MTRFRIITAILAFVGLVYCGWALNRMSSGYDDNWPRPFPYPDTWLDQYQNWLYLCYPGRPGGLLIHGRIYEVRLTLWVVFTAFTTVFLLAMAPALRKLNYQLNAREVSRHDKDQDRR